MLSQPVGTAQYLCEKASALAAALPALVVARSTISQNFSSGERRRRRAGVGEVFWQYRRYQPGDSASSIDWRQSAKSQHLFVREREWMTSNRVWLWCEHSHSSDYRSRWGPCSKFERSSLLLLALAGLLIAGGERVGLLGSRVHARSVLELAEALLIQPLLTALPEPKEAGTLLVAASDFWSPEWPGLISKLAKRGVQGYLLRVLDPAERDLPFSGRVLFEGTDKQQPVLIKQVESVRAGHRIQFMRHREELTQAVGKAGWSLSEHYTDQAALHALSDLYRCLSHL